MDKNIIGSQGENLTAIRLTQNGIFRESFLGEKFPVSDFIFEITDSATPYPFFVQVKTTDAADCYTVDNKRIKTPVPATKYAKLAAVPIPTYIAGIDLNKETVYLAPAFDAVNKYGGSIPVTYKLSATRMERNKTVLKRLRDDVIAYWRNINPNVLNYKNTFVSSML